MSIFLRRAVASRGLLAAAAAVALLATGLLTGLVAYGQHVVSAGARGAVSAASDEERAVLVTGAAGKEGGQLAERDTALRRAAAQELAGYPATVTAAGYAAGRAFDGDTGDAVRDSSGAVFAAVGFLDGLREHADLTAGRWPQAGGTPVQAALNAAAARILGIGAGDTIPIVDRVTDRKTLVEVAGLWQPRDLNDPYWLLAPEAATGQAPASATYGPLVIARDDFLEGYVRSASAGWLVQPDLTADPGVAAVRGLADAVDVFVAGLPEATGLGSSAVVTTEIRTLAGRLARADLVARSALLTPLLLIGVLSGLALVLVAGLLVENRRGESALLRARGAARVQLAGLSAREALLVVLPAGVVAPWPAAYAAGTRPTPELWLVAAVAALGCGLAVAGPALRNAGTYVAAMAETSRPRRRTVVQRAGIDLLLVVLAVLGWLQLRQYASPVVEGAGGTLGIDPLLAGAPVLGVLAGVTLGLRALPRIAGLLERVADRRRSATAMLGLWQAGRRPHGGPVALLAFAVAAATLAWCLAATADRSVADRTAHETGADIRVVETSGDAPADRRDRLTALPGVRGVLPVWREELPGVPGSGTSDLVAVDATALGGDVTVRSDLYGGGDLSDDLTAARGEEPSVPLPAGGRLTGRMVLDGPDVPAPTAFTALFDLPGGAERELPLGDGNGDFAVDLPAVAGAGPLRLAGFEATGPAVTVPYTDVRWRVTDLAVDGRRVDLPGRWALFTGGRRAAQSGTAAEARGNVVQGAGSYKLLRDADARAPVPAVATPDALARLRAEEGGTASVRLRGVALTLTIVGTIQAVPGTVEPAALLVDLPTLRNRLRNGSGVVHPVQEWWLTAAPGTEVTVPGVTVLDRRELAADAAGDRYGSGTRTALFAAAAGALLVALLGVAVDVRATARRRLVELTVLHTLGAGGRTLARALMTEQLFVAGLGVLAGLAVGVGVSVAMDPLLVLTPSAARPVPAALVEIDWLRAGGTALLVLLAALAAAALVGLSLPRRLAAAQLRIGADR